MSAHGDMCIVGRDVLEGAHVTIVAYTNGSFDLFSGGEAADEFFEKVERDPERHLAVVCLHCLIDAHPEAGRGMDLARQCGFAHHDGHDWITGDAA